MKKALALALIPVLLAGLLHADDARFSASPTTSRAGDTVRIAFAVSAPTDVEVAVLGADGKVVRHLAAGVLGGESPPPAPLRPGLKQELVWDGKDDAGNRVSGFGVQSGGPPSLTPDTRHPTPFSVRVRSGMKAELDGFLSEKKHWIGDLSGLAVGPGGDLYVYSSVVFSHRGHSRCLQVFSRDGKYLRTVMPPPATLPKEKLLPFNTADKVTLDVPGEHFVPRNYFGTWPEFYPGPMGQLCPRLTADGKLLLASQGGFARLDSDGGAADGKFWQPFWKVSPSHYTASLGFAAVPSPDGKFVYLSGLRSAKMDGGADTDQFPPGRIYRMKSEPGSLMEKFVDITGDRYSCHGNTISGADCDKDGNLLVCDWGGNRARVFSPEGREIGGFAVESPEYLACHRGTGAVYVLCASQAGKNAVERKLVKFSSWKADTRKTAEMAVPFRDTYIYYQEVTSVSLALDDRAEPPVVWVGQAHGSTDPKVRNAGGIWRVEDRGDSLARTLDLLDVERHAPAIMPRMAVHPDTEVLLYNDGVCGVEAVNGLTGEKVSLPFKNATDMGVGLDGNWYVQLGAGYSGPVCRFDRDFKPIPIPGKIAGKGVLDNALCDVYGRMGAGYCTVGLAADQCGRLYSLQMYDFGAYAMAIFGPDGKPEDPGRMKDDPKMQVCPRFKSAVVGPAGIPAGVQLDYQGNIYMGTKIVPRGHIPPAGFENARSGFYGMTGSIIKFGSQGGGVHAMKDNKPPAGKTGEVVDQRWGYGPVNYQSFVEEPLRIYPGLGCVSGGFGDGCMCRQPMFQVDGWGRIFYPCAATCSVKIVDNNGNLIREFGRYGNADSRGPGKGSTIRKPDVPLGWPQAVGVSHKAIYVSDVVNRRIMRLLKQYTVEEFCEIK